MTEDHHKVDQHIRIHNHPILERKLQVPDDHVIIDVELYMELMKRYGLHLPATDGPDIIYSPTPLKGES